MGNLVVCIPPPPPPLLLIFGFRHFILFKHFLLTCTCFVPKLPASVATSVFLKQAPKSLNNALPEKRERKQRKEPKRWGANNKLKSTENLYKKNISVQTSENDVSKSLISIFTFIKELYNSIIVQIPAPISKGCLVQANTRGERDSTRAGVHGVSRGPA